jgi:hypothetical protein
MDRLVPLDIRAAALMPAAVLTVHQLRFQLAFGSHTDSRLASEGHQYLGALAPVAAMLLAIGAGLFLAALSRAARRGAIRDARRRTAPSLTRLWVVAAAALLAIYCGQELLEGLLASGHPGGIAGVFGEGGLWAIPLSALFGALVALCLRGADAAICRAAERRRRPLLRRAAAWHSPGPGDVFPAPRKPLADAAAGRAPPPPLPVTS